MHGAVKCGRVRDEKHIDGVIKGSGYEQSHMEPLVAKISEVNSSIELHKSFREGRIGKKDLQDRKAS